MPVEPDLDAALMLRVKQGDTVAFAQLVDKYKQFVTSFISRIIGDPVEAEDIAQNVFFQVYRSANRYAVSSKFSTWLFTIARNLSLNEIRRRSRHPAESLDAPHPDRPDEPLRQIEDRRIATPPEGVLHAELEQKIAAAIGALPENQRTALLLCRREDLSYEDIAKVLGTSLSATKSIIFRGRETLKQTLKPYLRTGEWTPEK
jgi:RNA polymerase sigma-70 factor, ECF subfamily